MAMFKKNFWIGLLIANLLLAGCNASHSSDTANASNPTKAVNSDEETLRTGVLGEDYTSDDLDRVLAAVSAGLREVPWDTLDWEYYAQQCAEPQDPQPSQAAIIKPFLIAKQEGLSIYLGLINEGAGGTATELTFSFSGYPLQDSALVTEQSLSGTMCVRVAFDDIRSLRLKLRIYTPQGSSLSLYGKAIGAIPTTTLIEVPSITLYYGLWEMKFLDNPAPGGSIILNRLIRIDLDAQWLSFFLSLLNA